MTPASPDPYDENYDAAKAQEQADGVREDSPWTSVAPEPARPEEVHPASPDDPYAEADLYDAAPAPRASQPDDLWAPPPVEEDRFVPAPFEPVSADEGIRRSGLAYSAGIAFFAATAFMLFLGWLADWVLGSSPWGLVLGIVIGAAIGFIQFFRLTSQIFEKEGNSPQFRPLLSDHPDEPAEHRDS